MDVCGVIQRILNVTLLYLKMHWLHFNFLRGYLYKASRRTYNFFKRTALIPQQLSGTMTHCSARIHHSTEQIWHKLLIHLKLCIYTSQPSQWVSFIFGWVLMIPFCLFSAPTSFFSFFLRSHLRSPGCEVGCSGVSLDLAAFPGWMRMATLSLFDPGAGVFQNMVALCSYLWSFLGLLK